MTLIVYQVTADVQTKNNIWASSQFKCLHYLKEKQTTQMQLIPCILLQNHGFSNHGCNHKDTDVFYRYFIMQDNGFPKYIFWYTLHWYVSLVILHSSVNSTTITETKSKLLAHTWNHVFSWKIMKLKPMSVDSGPCRLSTSHTNSIWTSNVSV